MNLSFLPNFITLLRVFLLIPLSIVLLNEQYFSALILFVIAGFSDALDGFLAKQFSWISRFGAILDPLADKALLVITMSLLVYNQQLSWILLLVVFVRDIYIVVGAYYYHYRLGPYEMQPSNLSKFNTFVQLLLVTTLLVSLGFYQLPTLFIEGLILLTYVTTIASGIHYGWVWGGKFRQEIKRRKQQSGQSSNQQREQ
ncbi:CDP-alcohol phosphatidyltransferase family protein [Aliikangiella maris]|uniref:CDP-diacylglycerol--glycerol-3-phosphate 3-phosphatidyltransferase n=2 Tax=Aliikangiella maris TaxID=3162458 RepID=A0ABV3MI67_9GAMM